MSTRDPITNQTNTCCIATNSIETIEHEPNSEHDSNYTINSNDKRYFLKDVLLITVGGGNRDILVQSSMTTSQFSDIHVMSTCMQNVWLTTDHLSSVWCLQQVLVINRFLFSIIQPTSNRKRFIGNSFIKNKSVRLSNAVQHFTVRLSFNTSFIVIILKKNRWSKLMFILIFSQQENSTPKNKNDIRLIKNENDIGEWFDDIRRVFSKRFENGLNRTYVQMIRLNHLEHYKVCYLRRILAHK